MNVKGGITYIDFKGNGLSNITLPGITKTITKAYNSKKLCVLHNFKLDNEVLSDIPVFSIRKRVSDYVLTIAYTNSTDAKLTLRYIVVGANNNVTTYGASIG